MDIKNLPNKVIHYCWFGGNPLSELTKKCIESWKKFLPEFEIKEWNENNFDVKQCEFVKQAYEQKKWAFVADYTRFKVLEEFGGLYLDTDMEITANIAKYLEHELFVGQEDSKMINAAVVWSKEKNNKHIKEILKIYEQKEDFNILGDLYKESVPQVLTTYFEQYEFDKEKDSIQKLDNGSVYVYPMEYFYPLSYDHQHNKFTNNSCMIHHFDATWITPMEKFKTEMKRKNMKWVVYIIDFFVNSKNFICGYINYKDLLTFLIIFAMLFSITLAFKPLENIDILAMNNSNSISISLFVNVIIELILSYILTDIFKRIRLIEVNKLLDNNLLENKDNNYRDTHINDEKEKAISMYENKIWAIQMIFLVVLTFFCPISYCINAFELKEFIFLFGFLEIILILYVGIKKEFKYRILDLLMLSLVLGIMSMTGVTGIIISLIIFILISIEIFRVRLSKKRIIIFIVGILFFTITFFIINSIFSIFEINFSDFSNITNIKAINNIENYITTSNTITNFQFLNIRLVNITNVFFNSSILHLLISPMGVMGVAFINIVLICFLRRNAKYFYLFIPMILNTILSSNYNSILYCNYLALSFSVIVLAIYLFNRIYKNEKIKIN